LVLNSLDECMWGALYVFLAPLSPLVDIPSAVLTLLEAPASPAKEALSTYGNKIKTCTIHSTRTFRGSGGRAPAGFRGRYLIRRSGAKLPEVKGVLSFRSANEAQICPFFVIL